MVEIDKKIIRAYALKNHCISSESKFVILKNPHTFGFLKVIRNPQQDFRHFAKVNLIKNNRLNFN
ncbi:MAG: hypothetical protein WC979_07485 [Candidatus Pacearchaeota archaeon]